MEIREGRLVKCFDGYYDYDFGEYRYRDLNNDIVKYKDKEYEEYVCNECR